MSSPRAASPHRQLEGLDAARGELKALGYWVTAQRNLVTAQGNLEAARADFLRVARADLPEKKRSACTNVPLFFDLSAFPGAGGLGWSSPDVGSHSLQSTCSHRGDGSRSKSDKPRCCLCTIWSAGGSPSYRDPGSLRLRKKSLRTAESESCEDERAPLLEDSGVIDLAEMPISFAHVSETRMHDS